jgi:hypothetical protein
VWVVEPDSNGINACILNKILTDNNKIQFPCLLRNIQSDRASGAPIHKIPGMVREIPIRPGRIGFHVHDS